MIIGPLQPEDLGKVSLLTPEGWGDLAPHFAYNLQSVFCLPLKAEVDGELAGLGNIIYNEDTAWLSQIVVHPGFRNKGLGKAITGALLDGIDRNRYQTIMLDATDLGYPVYCSFGFETISPHVHLWGALLPPAPAPAAIVPYRETYLAGVLELDREACGENRSATLLEHISDALLYTEQDKVAGVYFPGSGRGAVLAANETAGTALLRLRMQEKQHSMLPEENKQAISFLVQQGFKEQRKSRRMRLGKARAWQPAFIYNTIGGALG